MRTRIYRKGELITDMEVNPRLVRSDKITVAKPSPLPGMEDQRFVLRVRSVHFDLTRNMAYVDCVDA